MSMVLATRDSTAPNTIYMVLVQRAHDEAKALAHAVKESAAMVEAAHHPHIAEACR